MKHANKIAFFYIINYNNCIHCWKEPFFVMRSRANYHAQAFNCCLKHFFSSLLICLSQIIAWCFFAAAAVWGFKHFSFYSLIALLPLAVFLFVYRFVVVYKLKSYFQSNPSPCKPYAQLILPALYRMGTGLLWLIPFAAVAYRFYQYIFVLPATTFTGDFTKIGAFISKDAALSTQLLIGTGIFFALLFITAVIFLYGWRNGCCFDFAQTKGCSFLSSLKYAKKLRKATRKRRFINTLLHTIIFLPAFIVPCILPISQLSPMLTGKAMNDIQLLYVYLSAGIVSDGTLLLSLGIFLLLYLPLLPFRKLHNIAALHCW